MPYDYLATVKTASEVADEWDVEAQNGLDATAAAAAGTANVTHSEYINYNTKMTNYESRDDVEPLAERRAREAGDQFTDTDFRRAGTGSIAVFTSPGDQNVG
jgi:hypothetical protein